MRLNRFPFRCLAVRTGLVLGALLFARAAAAQSLALAPAEVIATVKPGQPFKVEFSVSNSGNQPVAIRSSVTDLWYDEKNEKTFGPAGSSPHSAAPWIQFVPRLLTVDANSSARLTAFITPPADARGGHYAVAFVESKPELAQSPTPDAQPVYANIRLGALVLLTVDGTAQHDVQLSDFVLAPPTGQDNLKLEFTVANKGNTHVFPKATLAILNREKQMVAKTEADVKRFLPGQTDTLEMSWGARLPAGEYEGVLTVVYGGKQLLTKTLPFTVDN
jgi:hypothetical protein